MWCWVVNNNLQWINAALDEHYLRLQQEAVRAQTTAKELALWAALLLKES